MVGVSVEASKHYDNPLYGAAVLLSRLSRAEPVVVDRVWTVFVDYLEAEFVRKDRNAVDMVLSTVEGELIEKVTKKLAKSMSDEYVEAGALLYFICRHKSIDKRYRLFIETLYARIVRCIEDRKLVDPSTSPGLSKCLGLAHVAEEDLATELKDLEALYNKCKELNLAGHTATFCVYTAFAKALSSAISKNKEEAQEVQKTVKDLSSVNWLTEDHLGLLMLSYGIAKHVAGKETAGDQYIVTLFASRIQEKLEKLNEYQVRSTRKRLWLILRAALALNGLKRISYVGENHIVLEKDWLRGFIDDLSWFIDIKKELASSAPGIAVAVTSVLTIFNLVPKYLSEPLQTALAIFIALLIVFAIRRLLFKWLNLENKLRVLKNVLEA